MADYQDLYQSHSNTAITQSHAFDTPHDTVLIGNPGTGKTTVRDKL